MTTHGEITSFQLLEATQDDVFEQTACGEIETENRNEELLKACDTLEQTCAYYDGLYEDAPIGIMVTDAERRVVRINDAFSIITGFAPEDIIDRTPSLLSSHIHNESFYQTLWATVNCNLFWQGEIQDVRKDGEPLPIWLTISATEGADGRITHYVGSFTNLTRQKQAEDKLRTACLRLGERAADVRRVLEKQKADHTEMEMVLKVLLKWQAKQKIETVQAILDDMDKTVLPFLHQLKTIRQTPAQQHLLAACESNLLQLMRSYGQPNKPATLYRKLTRSELQVASLIQLDLQTKVIAATLNISPATVESHRKAIRRKLGLLGDKSISLRAYLQSVADG